MKNIELQEASLSRVWKHFNDEDTTVVIMTGFRDEATNKENIARNKNIASNFKNQGFGYFYVDGYWIENEGTLEEIKVSEDSIFVSTNDKNKSKELIELSHTLANKYNQDVIFVKTPTEVKLIFRDGLKEIIKGSIRPGKLGNFYTKLRNNKKTNTFVFESERDGLGYLISYSNYLREQGLIK